MIIKKLLLFFSNCARSQDRKKTSMVADGDKAHWNRTTNQQQIDTDLDYETYDLYL